MTKFILKYLNSNIEIHKLETRLVENKNLKIFKF